MTDEKQLSEEQAELLEKDKKKGIYPRRRACHLPEKSIYDCRQEVMNMTLLQIKKAEPLYLARTRFLAMKIINEHGMDKGKKDYGAINSALNFLRLEIGKSRSVVTDGKKLPVVSKKKIKPERYEFGTSSKIK